MKTKGIAAFNSNNCLKLTFTRNTVHFNLKKVGEPVGYRKTCFNYCMLF